jgi:Fe-S cluster biosynthesis and repair protein YggX
MKFENTEVFNFAGAFRGMRNPMNSWNKSDSGYYGYCTEDNKWVKDGCSYDACLGACAKNKEFKIGKNDLELAQKLIKAGSEHRKFLRQIFVAVDITAPLFFFKEMDTYKVGTVANSTSTMHKLASTPITMDCFEMDDYETELRKVNLPLIWQSLLFNLETLRKLYNETKDKRYWKELIRLLPESWLQKRTVTMNYENVLNMVHQRRNHKLTEWSESFINWAKTLPYAEELIFIGGVDG